MSDSRQLINQLAQLDHELTTQRRIRLSVRSAWVAGLVLCLGLVLRGWTTLAVSLPLLLVLTGLVLVLGVVYAWLPARGTHVLAQDLDRAYGLNEQLATAHEISYYEQHDGFSDLLADRARRRLAILGKDVISLAAEPLRVEIQTLLLVAMLGAGILLFGGMSRGLPTNDVQPLAELKSPALAQPPGLPGTDPEPDQPAGGERPAANQNGKPQLDQQGQQAVDALSKALRDQAPTRAAADALQQGDTQAAANELRQLADQADQLSQDARNDLADALDQAAGELQNDQTDLAYRLRDQANQLRSDNPQAAKNAIDDLAQTVEDLAKAQPDQAANQPNQQGNTQNSGTQGQENNENTGQQGQNGNATGQGSNPASDRRSSPPADANGQGDMPLPPVPDPGNQTTPGQGNGDTTITLPGSGGSGGGSSGGNGGSVPADISDPSLIPPELRDAIQNYFGR